jgi:hypothetical protein
MPLIETKGAATPVSRDAAWSRTSLSLLNRRFYFLMSLMVAALVGVGFGPTISARLIHPSIPRLLILYVHVTVFTGWVILFIVQTMLISRRNVTIHRKLGWLGAALGVLIPLLGSATAVAMGRMDLHPTNAQAAFLMISFYDMAAFGITFAWALNWRNRPEFHRRLMLIATRGLL